MFVDFVAIHCCRNQAARFYLYHFWLKLFIYCFRFFVYVSPPSICKNYPITSVWLFYGWLIAIFYLLFKGWLELFDDSNDDKDNYTVDYTMGEMGNKSWCHISTGGNTPDLATRGLIPADLRENRLRWHGPDGLN